jgi:hypothetical protein
MATGVNFYGETVRRAMDATLAKCRHYLPAP